MRLPIRTRLTLVFAGVTLVVLAVAAASLLLGFRAEMRSTVDERLRSLFGSLEESPRAAGTVPTTDEEFLQYVDPDGSLVTSRGPTERLLPPALTESLDGRRFFDRDVWTLEELVPVRVLAGPVAPGGALMVAVDVEDQREAVIRLTTLVVVGGPLLLLALSFLGWILAGAALRPVEELRSEAAAISTTEPERRLPVPETGDELQRLAETLNGMLDRLHDALDRERRFVDEASHELRTPLGVLKAELDLALKEPRSPEELEAALQSIAEETERLRRLTQDLLVLARSDRGRLPVHRAEVDVSEDRRTRHFGVRGPGPCRRRASPVLRCERTRSGGRRPRPAGRGEPRRQRDPSRGPRRNRRDPRRGRGGPSPRRRARLRARIPPRALGTSLRALRPGGRRA